MPAMASLDRLSGLDSSFLHLEHDATHMHVAACAIFEGPPPTYEELLEEIVSRLHHIPRYRQRLATVPYGQGRPTMSRAGWSPVGGGNVGHWKWRNTSFPRGFWKSFPTDLLEMEEA